MLWGSGAIFLRLLGSHRGKMSRWKNLFVFQRLMFLYQLVNLVLETCFIFSKTLKLGKTFVLSFSFRSIVRTTSVMIPLFQIFGTKVFKKMLILECLGVILQSQLWCPSWIFDTSLSERCLNCWLVKEIITFGSRASCRTIKIVIMACGSFDFFFQFFFEEKSPYRVGRHVEINLKLIHMAFGCDVRWFIIESPVGCHVLWLIVKYMDLLKPVGFSKTH